MITDLWIENFKGIGKRQHIPLSPITLLFGANSAGKSTVLHALLYLRQIVSKRTCDLKSPISGEQTVSLGGFSNLQHRSSDQINNTVRLGVQFSVSEAQKNAFVSPIEEKFDGKFEADRRGLSNASGGEWKSYAPQAPVVCKIDLAISRHDSSSSPCVTSFRLNVDGEDFISLELSESRNAVGWVNLVSNAWRNPESPPALITYRKFKIGFQDFTMLLLPILHAAARSASQECETSDTTSCATNLLECPVFESFIGNVNAIAFHAAQHLQNNLIPLVEYLSSISLYSTPKEIEQFVNTYGSSSVYVVVAPGQNTRSKGLPENGFAQEYLSPPLAVLANGKIEDALRVAVGIIRHYWTRRFVFLMDEDGSAFQGPWTHEVEFELGGWALPRHHDSLRSLSPNDFSPSFDYA